MKKIYLHIGLPKTGSSSLQLTFHENRNLLLKKGIFYPEFEYDKHKIINHSYPLESLFCDNPNSYQMNLRMQVNVSDLNQYYLEELTSALSFDYILLSAEGVPNLSELGLRKMIKFLESNGHQIHVICFIRKPYDFLCSFFLENVKMGGRTDFKTGVPKIAKTINKLLINLKEDINFYSFEEAQNHNDGLVGYFFEKININFNKIKIYRDNDGISSVSSRYYAYLNKYFPTFVNGKLNPNRRLSPIKSFGNDRFLLTEDEYKAVHNELFDDASELFSLTGIDNRETLINVKLQKNFSINSKLAKEILIYATKDIKTLGRSICFLIVNKDVSWSLLDLKIWLNEEVKNKHEVIDALRDFAVSIESESYQTSYNIMSLISDLRPEGKFIQNRMLFYSKALGLKYSKGMVRATFDCNLVSFLGPLIISELGQKANDKVELSAKAIYFFSTKESISKNIIIFPYKSEKHFPKTKIIEHVLYNQARQSIPIGNHFKDEFKNFIDHPLLNIDFSFQHMIVEDSYYAGVFMPHYGHFILETLTRLWGFISRQVDNKKLKIVFNLFGSDSQLKVNQIFDGYYKDYFDLLGISKEQVLFIDKPVIFKSIIIASPSLVISNQDCFYSNDAIKVFELISKRAIQNSKINDFAKLLYLSRRKVKKPIQNRIMLNEEALEKKLLELGFKIIYPEDFASESDKIAQIANAEIIVSGVGSGALSAVFSKKCRKFVSILNPLTSKTNPALTQQIFVNYFKKIESHVYMEDEKRCEKNGLWSIDVDNFSKYLNDFIL